jgi:hypothetical protein
MNRAVTDRLYRGERMKDRTAVTVHDAPGSYEELTDPAGMKFDWGRATAGALALAHALTAEAGGVGPDVEECFFNEVVLPLPFLEPWVLWRRDLEEWVAKHPEPATVS